MGISIASSCSPPPPPLSGGGAGAPPPAVQPAPAQQALPPVGAGGPTVDTGQVITALTQVVQALQQLVTTLQSQQAPSAQAGGGGPAGACMGADGLCTMTGGAGGGGNAAPTAGTGESADAAAPATPPLPSTRKPSSAIGGGGASAAASANRSSHPLGHLTPNQLTDGTGLSTAEGESACGPAAATALARFLGKDLDLGDVTRTAQKAGLWTQADGMGGPDAEKALLDKIGVKATKVDGPVDWDRVRRTVQAGTPVVIGTPGHYWVAERYDPATGKFDFGTSGSVFTAAHGNTWYKPSELHVNGKGDPRVAFYLDG